MDKIGKFARAAAFVTATGAGIVISEYQDVFGFDQKTEAGRTKNSISAVVAGIVGQRMYGGSSTIDVNVEKVLWPSAHLTGTTSPLSIGTYVDLALTSAQFSGHNNSQGMLEGAVDKSEFDWRVKQTGQNHSCRVLVAA